MFYIFEIGYLNPTTGVLTYFESVIRASNIESAKAQAEKDNPNAFGMYVKAICH